MSNGSEPNLLAARLRLRVAEDSKVNVNQRRATYWLGLALIAEHAEELAQELRRPAELRPFTLSNLVCPKVRPHQGQLSLTPQDECYIRLTALSRPVVEALMEVATDLPTRVMLGEQPMEAVALDWNDDSFERTGTTSYSTILERCFYTTGSVPYLFRLRFLSPTGFKTEGQELPLPLPKLVFGSLLQRWNAFSPGPLAEDSRLFAELSLRLGHFELRSHSLAIDEQYHTGFSGLVEFRASGRDRFYLQTLQALSQFSFYAGVGYQTAAGFGQVQPL